MSTLTVRIPKEMEQLVEEYCKSEDRSKSWLLKKALQEKLEDWIDYRDGVKALKKYQKNPGNTITHEELLKKLGLSRKDLD